MNSISTQGPRCVVTGEEALPPELGGEEAICSAIARASIPVLRSAGVSPHTVVVAVQVRSAYRLSAATTVGGRSLPEQQVGISDRPLDQQAVDMLAQAVAAGLSNLGQQ